MRLRASESEVLSHLGRMFGMVLRVQWGQKSPKSWKKFWWFLTPLNPKNHLLSQDFWDAFIYFPLSSSLLCTTGRVALYMSTYEHRRAEVSLCKLAHIYPSTLAYFLALHIMWHNFIAFLFHSTSLFAQSYQKKTSKVLFAQFPFLAHRLPLH